MDKFLLQQQVLERLAEDLPQAEQAMRAASVGNQNQKPDQLVTAQ